MIAADNTVLGAFARNAARLPDATALTSGAVTVSYRVLEHLVDDGARRLATAGIRPGDRVMIIGENSTGWVVAFLAAMRSGAIAVPLNNRLGGAQLPALCETIEPALILADHRQADLVAPVRGRWRVKNLDPQPDSALSNLPGPGPADALPRSPHREAPALIAFTSGTTSTPKGAVISHAALFESVRSWLVLTGADETWSTTVLVPLFHNTAYVDQVAQMLVCGGTLDIPGRYRTDEAVDAMLRRPPTFLVMVPAIAVMLSNHPDADRAFASCHFLGVGGAALAGSRAAEMMRRWPNMRISHGYGLTEFTSLSHALPPELIPTAGDSVGFPVHGIGCSIRDYDGEEAARGEIGEVWLAGPPRMTEYWRNPGATAGALQGRWLRTGDLGRVDADGLLWLHGRVSTTINRGGEKVSPEVVESVLSTAPNVDQVCVVGVEDDILGQRIGAAIVSRGGGFDATTARAAVGDRLPDYAWPDHIVVLDQLPLAATGKVDRRLVAGTVAADAANESSIRKGS